MRHKYIYTEKPLLETLCNNKKLNVDITDKVTTAIYNREQFLHLFLFTPLRKLPVVVRSWTVKQILAQFQLPEEQKEFTWCPMLSKLKLGKHL